MLTQPASRRRRRGSTFIPVGYVLSTLYAVLLAIPLYFVFVSAFKDNSEIFSSPLGLPSSWSFDKFVTAQEQVDIIGAMQNSFVITVGTELLTLFLAFLAAYGIARVAAPGSRIVELIFSMGFLIPTFALLIPVFLIAARTGFLDSPIYLIAFYTASRLSLSVVVLASSMRQVPRELEESAALDGANVVQIMRHVVFPLVQPAVATVLILNFIYVWNEYLFALVLLGGENRTVQLVLPLLRSIRLVDYGLVAAGIAISIIPVFIMFVLFQERIMKGMFGGATKG